jgi:hypothetical protein
MPTIKGCGRSRLRAAVFWVWLGVNVSVQGQALDGQTRQEPPRTAGYYTFLDQEAYDRVLDLIFPAPPEISKDIMFTMSVRFLPSSRPESQILVTLFQGKLPSVTYTVADKLVFASAYRRVEPGDKLRIMPSDEAEIARIAKGIAVASKVVEIDPERVLGWQQGMFRSLGDSFLSLRRGTEDLYRKGTLNLLLDGPMYEVRYTQRYGEFFGRFTQTVEGLAVAKWAELLRSEAESAKAR